MPLYWLFRLRDSDDVFVKITFPSSFHLPLPIILYTSQGVFCFVFYLDQACIFQLSLHSAPQRLKALLGLLIQLYMHDTTFLKEKR